MNSFKNKTANSNIRGIAPPVNTDDVIDMMVKICEAINVLDARTEEIMLRIESLERIGTQGSGRL